MREIKSSQVLFAALVIVFVSTLAPAVLLMPGNSVALPGTNLPGFVVEDNVLPVVVGPCVFSLRDRVTQNGDGTYNFNHFFQLISNPFAADGISVAVVAFIESGFTGYLTNVDWDPTTFIGTVNPLVASRSADSDVILFSQYDPPIINLGEASYFTTTQTNAMDYDVVGTSTIVIVLLSPTGDPLGQFSGTVATFNPIPEPASLILLGVGCLFAFRKLS